MQFSNFSWGHAPRPTIAIGCLVQHNKHKKLLTSSLGWLLLDSTENKIAPLNIKHLPTPMA